MKMKIVLLGLLFGLMSQLSQAISIGSISDAISNHTSTNASQNTARPAEEDTAKNTPTTQRSAPRIAEKTAAASTETHLPNPALFVEDAAMTGYIHSQLLLQRNIPSVNVTTENAVVSLSGTVDTQEQADKLVKIASAVKGVKRVDTEHLVIREKI